MGFGLLRVWGLGFRVWGLGFRDFGLHTGRIASGVLVLRA